MGYKLTFLHRTDQITESQWQALARHAGPFLQYTFLHQLEATGCVGSNTGWQTCHAAIYEDNHLVAIMPGYLKQDSYGEYVFDHGWASAYHQHGIAYYPKWVAAVPFTPVTGARLLCSQSHDSQSIIDWLIPALKSQLSEQVSSLHVLFPDQQQHQCLAGQQMLSRYSVQFQWYNYQYTTFSDFTAALTSRKRKSLRKSRERLSQQGVRITRKTGCELTAQDKAFFIRCYQQTYLKRSGHTGYLSPAFFDAIFTHMASNILLVLASQDDAPCAAALFFFDEQHLFGRYWGALTDIDGLHFECCYFQGIEFAIEQHLADFNPGTQGEHKILRGFEPVLCRSSHYLFEPAFQQAVADFLHRETPVIIDYFQQAVDVLPYNEAQQALLQSTKQQDVVADIVKQKQRNDNEI